MNANRTIFKWVIPKFEILNLCKNEEGATSKTFIVSKNSNCNGRIELRIPNHSKFYFRDVEFYLTISNFNIDDETFQLYVKYSMLNSNREVITQSIILKKISPDTKYYLGTISGLKYGRRIDKFELLFEIEKSSNVELQLPKEQYETFLTDKKLNDVILQVGDKTIDAVKGILASKSQFFNAMFTTDMTESISRKVIKIVDIDYETFIEILRFMYSGKVEKLDLLALKIFKAAHVFQMNDLLHICERSLIRNIDFENVIEILKVAGDCQQQSLKSNCILFMRHNSQCVEKSYLFKNLRNHPDLLLEMIESMSLQ